MAYLLVPNANDKLKVSQGQIQTNFTEIQTSFDVNHVDFDAANTGMHKFVQFTLQASDPGTGGNILALYSKDGDSTAKSELYLKQSDGSVNSLTEYTTNTETADDGFFHLGDGSLVAKFNVQEITAGFGTIVFTTGGTNPVFLSTPIVFTQVIENVGAVTNCNIVEGSISTTGFQVFMSNNNTCDLNWIAIATV